jgi:hypothetical protein
MISFSGTQAVKNQKIKKAQRLIHYQSLNPIYLSLRHCVFQVLKIVIVNGSGAYLVMDILVYCNIHSYIFIPFSL